jgi:hypothetical protein
MYSVQTASAAHTGSLPSAGPAVSGGANGRFGPGGRRGLIGFGGGALNGPTAQGGNGATIFNGAAGGNGAPGAPGAPAGAMAANGFGGAGASRGTPGAGASRGTAGGLLDASRPSAALVTLLEQNADRYTWVAATVGAQSAAGYQLATDDPVMSLGGFNGSDPYPTLAEFEALVGAGKVHYFIAGGTGALGNAGASGNTVGPMGLGAAGSSSNGTQLGGGDSSMSAISAWVEAHFTSRTVGGITVYDLTSRSG